MLIPSHWELEPHQGLLTLLYNQGGEPLYTCMWIFYIKGWQTFSAKGLIVNILGFVAVRSLLQLLNLLNSAAVV